MIVENHYKKYLTFDEPVTYKKLIIRPANLKEYYDFFTYAKIYSIERDDPTICVKYSDLDLIKELKFLTLLFYLEEGQKRDKETKLPYLFLFDKLIKLVCDLPATRTIQEKKKDKEINYIDYKNDDEEKNGYLIIDDEIYTADDVDIILEIIRLQNGIEGVDYTKTKELRDVLDRALEVKNKQSGGPAMADLENRIMSLSVATGWRLEDIYDFSIRKFEMALARIDKLLTWQIYTSASMSGLVKFPKNTKALDHWLTSTEKADKYSGAMTSFEGLTEKVTNNKN